MKKRNFKTKVIMFSATILSAALMQACGSSNSAPPIVDGSSSVVNTVTGALNSGLYQACAGTSGTAQMVGEEYGVTLTSATLTTSPYDGASVCQVVFSSEVEDPGSSRAFLGPAAGSSEGIETAITLAPWDEAVFNVEGSYGSGEFSELDGCSGNAIAAGGVYGYVYGLNEFALGSTPISVPQFGGGQLYVGLNQSPGSSGCMVLEVTAEIQRCVNSSGATDECPSSSLTL